MYHRILVPLDGSPFAEHALPAAVAIARLTDASIHLVLVHERRELNVRGSVPDHVSRQRELDYLHATAARVIASGARAVDVALGEGWVPAAIERESARTSADLIIMTDRGGEGRGTRCLGLVTSSVIRHGGRPVLVMRTTDRAADLGRGPVFRHVLVAIEDAVLDASVAGQAAELAHLAARPPGRRMPNGADAISVEMLPASAILDAVARRSVDLVAVSTQASTPVRITSGGIAERLACCTPLPILACPVCVPEERAV